MTIIAEKGGFSVRKIRDNEYRLRMETSTDFVTWNISEEDVLNLADVLIEAKEIIAEGSQ